MKREKIIVVDNVTKKFEVMPAVFVEAIKNVNLEVFENETVGIIGANGAGKTTLIKLIGGFIKPDSGSINIKGQEPEEVRNTCKLSFLTETRAGFENFKVIELIDLIVDSLQASENIDELLNNFNLIAHKEKQIKQLSTGLRQRVFLLLTFLGKPEIIFLDEPTNGLDPLSRYELKQVIKSYKKSKTFIITSHLLSDIQDLCDRIVILDFGEKIFDGRIDEFLEKMKIDNFEEAFAEFLKKNREERKTEVD